MVHADGFVKISLVNEPGYEGIREIGHYRGIAGVTIVRRSQGTAQQSDRFTKTVHVSIPFKLLRQIGCGVVQLSKMVRMGVRVHRQCNALPIG